MSQRKVTTVIVSGTMLLGISLLRTMASDGESGNAQVVTFKPVETKAGWLVEGSVGTMTFRATQLTFRTDHFSHAQVHAKDGHVVLVNRNKNGDGHIQARQIQVSIAPEASHRSQ